MFLYLSLDQKIMYSICVGLKLTTYSDYMRGGINTNKDFDKFVSTHPHANIVIVILYQHSHIPTLLFSTYIETSTFQIHCPFITR